MKFELSVIIPVYNREKEIESCLKSVLNQSFPVTEIIVIDDGSTDGTLDVIKSFNEERIKLFQNLERKGVSYARNIGITNSNSEWIAFLDSDDEWKVDRIRNLVDFLTKNNKSSVYSGSYIYDGYNMIFRNSRRISESESIFDFVISNEVYIPTPTLVIKKEIAKVVLFDENLDRHEDYDFIVRAHCFSNWKYFNSSDVIVNRIGNEKRKIDFTGCLNFYLKNKNLSKNKAARINYLRTISEMVGKNNPQVFILNSFKKELFIEEGKLSFREFMLFNFPFIFYYVWKFRRKIVNYFI